MDVERYTTPVMDFEFAIRKSCFLIKCLDCTDLRDIHKSVN